MPKKKIPALVWTFGLISFLTDMSSDMIFPLLPVFLTVYLGAGQSFLGLIEGIADSAAAFFMLASGIAADRSRDRAKLVFAGYGLSSIAKPLLAFAASPWVVLAVRFCDRIGKGIRTSPRDALIADAVEPALRGQAYGLQRSLDHAGAIAGPLLATLLLSTIITDLRHIFMLAAIPGMLAVALIVWKVRDLRPAPARGVQPALQLTLPGKKLRLYLAVLFVFLWSCSSDAFLLLRARELGVSAAFLPLLWMGLHIIKASTTLPFGMLSDRVGRRRVILGGWCVYTLVYAGFALASQAWQACALFAAYGLFHGMTEGSERAILAEYAPAAERGRAFGWYYFIIGLVALPANLVFGLLWQKFGAGTAFFISAGISACASVLLLIFLRFFPSQHPNPDSV